MSLVQPHGVRRTLQPLLVPEPERAERLARAGTLPRIEMTSRETSDLIMLGIGAFTPLSGFMGEADWRASCGQMQLADGTFWPLPITVSAMAEQTDGLAQGSEVALADGETGEIMATMRVEERYRIDRQYECLEVYRTADPAHPGVAKVMEQGEFNLAGPVEVLSEGRFPQQYAGLYLSPTETRELFQGLGWSTVAAFQTRNPMHRAHEYLAKVAVEICDGVLIHQLLGRLKAGDIPAEVRVRAIDALVSRYFVPGTCVQAGYPMEMRYAGPREALLHAVFRQNYGCSHLIVGRDHAGVGSYYGPFDAQAIFKEIPEHALQLRPMFFDLTFYCRGCDGMASSRTCPHDPDQRLLISGTDLRQMLSRGDEVPEHFSRPEVLEILKEHYLDLARQSDSAGSDRSGAQPAHTRDQRRT